jgi:hypothetical protein
MRYLDLGLTLLAVVLSLAAYLRASHGARLFQVKRREVFGIFHRNRQLALLDPRIMAPEDITRFKAMLAYEYDLNTQELDLHTVYL